MIHNSRFMIQRSFAVFSMLLFLPSLVWAQDITSGLVGHWKFDEGSGTTAADSSGNNNTGTLTPPAGGPTWTTGKIGGAVSFDGVDDYVGINLANQLPIYRLSGYTVAFWVKASPQNSTVIFGEGNTNSSAPLFQIMSGRQDCCVNRIDRLGARISANNFATPLDSTKDTNANVLNNTWRHVVWVDINGAATFYIDGVQDSNSFSYVPNSNITLNAVAIAALLRSTASSFFTGTLDDVRLYNRTLTLSDIQALYNLGSGTPPPSDTTTPTVSLTSPTSGSIVGSSVTVSANASDNVGVVGVQFKLDGANLGTEDTTSPYSIAWNTTGTSNGSHTLTATARDAAGNTTTSSGITITVDNVSSDTQSPTTPTNLSASAVSSSQINLSWTASTDNVGVTGYRVERCQGSSCTNFAQIATPTGTGYSDTGLTANTTYRYQVRAVDAAGNLSNYSSIASATTQSSGGQNPTLSNLPNNTALDLGLYPCVTMSGDSPCRGITDYSRFSYDATNHQMLMFGGGHATTFRDDVDVFNFSTLTWNPAYPSTPCSEMTLSNLNSPNATWYSNGRPISRHTYDMMAVTDSELIVMLGGYGRGGCAQGPTSGPDPYFTGNKISHYNPVTKIWRLGGQVGTWFCCSAVEYDPVSKKIILIGFTNQGGGGNPMWVYDPATFIVTPTTLYPPDSISVAKNLIYFPPNQKMYYIANGNTVFEVTLDRANWNNSTFIQVSGITGTIPTLAETGFAYDSVNQIIGGGIQNGIFYAFNPLTKVWASRTMQTQPAGGSPGTVAFHALDYDPINNVFIYISKDPLYGLAHKTWAYKYGDGGSPPPLDTTPPSIPSGLTATTVSSSQINLSWTASTDNVGVTGYRIYRGGSQITTVTGTSYSDSGLSPSTTYSYTLTAYDAAGNVSAQSSSASATTQSSTPSTNNTITITDTSGTTQTNRPVSISRPFKQGDIPQFAQASIAGSSLLTQTDVKNRWPDGSLKFAIVSFIIPNLPANGSVTISFSNQSTGNNTGYLTQAQLLDPAYDFEGTIQMTGDTTQTVSARTMLQNNNFRYWLQGPIVTAVIIEDRTLARTYDKDLGDGSKALHPIYEAWFYPQNKKVELGYTVENTWSSNTASKSMRDQTYSLTLQSGNTNPITEFTQPSFIHIGKSRWHKTYWLGADPGKIRVNHNMAYLTSTKMIPNYDTSLTVAESLISSQYSSWLSTDKTLDGGTIGVGNYDKVFASAGQHDWIGLGNTWDILYLFTMDDRMLEKSLGNADLGGRIPFHFREADTLAGRGDYFDAAGTVDTFGRPVSLNARRELTLADLTQTCGGTIGADQINTGTITDGGWAGYNMGRHHFPDFAYIPYLMTGRYYYLEEEQMLASYMIGYGNGCSFESWQRQGSTGYFGDGETRGNAWAYRSTLYAAFISPDGSPEKVYYEDKLLNNIALDEGRLVLPCSTPAKQTHCTWGENNRQYPTGPSPLGLWWEGNSGLVGAPVKTDGSVKQAFAPWQQHFIVQSLGMARDFGYKTDNLLQYAAIWGFNQLLNPATSPYPIEAYLYPTILTATNDWIRTWSAVNNYINTPTGWSLGQDVDQGYGFLALAASSFLYPYNAGGYTGQQAWNFIKANKPQQNLFATVSPKQAILPRTSSAPPPTTLVGDLNQDGTVNSFDWSIMAGVWFTADATADLNKDGIVNSIDFSLLNRNWGRTI